MKQLDWFVLTHIKGASESPGLISLQCYLIMIAPDCDGTNLLHQLDHLQDEWIMQSPPARQAMRSKFAVYLAPFQHVGEIYHIKWDTANESLWQQWCIIFRQCDCSSPGNGVSLCSQDRQQGPLRQFLAYAGTCMHSKCSFTRALAFICHVLGCGGLLATVLQASQGAAYLTSRSSNSFGHP